MPATKSYLIPLSDLTLSDRQDIRINVQAVLESNAQRLAIRDRIEDLVIRDTLPNTDLGLAAQEDWLVAGAGVLATELQYISAAIAQDRCIAFYGVGYESAAQSISRIRFTLGAASTTVRGVFQLEQMFDRLEPAGYFSSPIVYTRQETARIMVMPRIAFGANTERVHLLGRTIEPIGAVVSAPSV